MYKKTQKTAAGSMEKIHFIRGRNTFQIIFKYFLTVGQVYSVEEVLGGAGGGGPRGSPLPPRLKPLPSPL